jgi:hypothetical protein
VSDLKLSNPMLKGSKVSLQSQFMATTFRFNDAGATAGTAKKKGGQK